jgi:ribulose-phosphate 3-epimerase
VVQKSDLGFGAAEIPIFESRSVLSPFSRMNKKRLVKIEPSILSADFGCLGREAKKIEEAGADAIHIDIMDGHFVRNLSFGPKAVSAINRQTDLFLDVHMMVYNPFDYIERFVEAGADRLTFHFEATEEVEETLDYVRRCNIQAGLAFCPETSSSMIPKYLDKCDLILLMTVQPGFGGQTFIRDVLEKIEFARMVCDRLEAEVEIQVDGGIDKESGQLCIDAGATNLVSGTYLFKAHEMRQAIAELRGL